MVAFAALGAMAFILLVGIRAAKTKKRMRGFSYDYPTVKGWLDPQKPPSPAEINLAIRELERSGEYWTGVSKSVLGLASLVTFIGAALGLAGSSAPIEFALAVVATALSALLGLASEGARVSASPLVQPDLGQQLLEVRAALQRRQAWVTASFALLGVGLVLALVGGMNRALNQPDSVPNMVGKERADAQESLEKEGYSVDRFRYVRTGSGTCPDPVVKSMTVNRNPVQEDGYSVSLVFVCPDP